MSRLIGNDAAEVRVDAGRHLSGRGEFPRRQDEKELKIMERLSGKSEEW